MLLFENKIMKLPKTFFILLILLVSLKICFGQEKPKAELIDNFTQSPCDETMARVDNFTTILRNEPESKGLVISFGLKDKNLRNLRYEQFFKDAVKGRIRYQFDVKRVTFIRGANEEKLRVQLWKIPANADLPAYETGNWSYSLADQKKPFIYYARAWFDDICPPTTDSELYSKLLLANPNFRGHLLIYTESTKKFRKVRNDLSKEIINTYKVPRTQLKFFYVKSKRENFNIEHWLVPRKSK